MASEVAVSRPMHHQAEDDDDDVRRRLLPRTHMLTEQGINRRASGDIQKTHLQSYTVPPESSLKPKVRFQTITPAQERAYDVLVIPVHHSG